ncbi:hypothetical protein [Asticcacaulis sp. YBE204]|uniref:hypothetical protein n=1 Tax=Asticcacaulis sp. YBE204 TaxID=1282363 RepID=UPI0003C407DE|nr:hypothetical protein [Asticcacaulis sp. YBE204]ESQ77861.1 hypothetical protein AEYBE204_17175 [Asticcacaulis sp. YBE204]
MTKHQHHVQISETAAGGHDPLGLPRREDDSPLLVTGADSLFNALEDTLNPARAGEVCDTVRLREIELA